MLCWEETRGRPRIRWSDYVPQLAWEHLGILPEELEAVSGEREKVNTRSH